MTTSKNIHKSSSFKHFINLPISNKLRYLRNWVKERHRKIKRYIHSIQEFNLVNQISNGTVSDHHNISKDWQKNIDAGNLRQKAHQIHSVLSQELEERDKYMEAISSHHRKACNATNSRPWAYALGGNTLNLSDKTVKLINSWLDDAGGSQCFNTESNKDKFAFLLLDMESWMGNLQSIHVNHINWDCQTSISNVKDKLSQSCSVLGKLERKIRLAQFTYCSNTIEYLLKVNRIEDFTQKVCPKSRESPATHTEIWDTEINRLRPCQNEDEELTATVEHHGQWMGNSEAAETCAFAKLEHKGLLGVRGIELLPDRKVTFSDIPNLIKNGEKLPDKDKKAFVAAHGKHTAELF